MSSKKIVNLPLSDICRVVVFRDPFENDFTLTKEGTVIFHNGKYVDNDFANARMRFKAHKLYRYEKVTDDIAKTLYANAKMVTDTPLADLIKFVSNNSDIIFDNRTWFILPHTTKKKLAGKPTKIIFDIGRRDFAYGQREFEELDVYITPITKESKSVKFSMYIPEFIYDKCITCNDIDERPKVDYIEMETLSGLHKMIDHWVGLAQTVHRLEKEANEAKKVLCVSFHSNEIPSRDGLNHAYLGQEIKTDFSFCVAYQMTNGRLYSYKKYQTGMGTTEKGIKGIIDNEIKGYKNFISDNYRPTAIIEWTQERENYLSILENQFRLLSVNLNSFLKDLNEEKLMQLINNNTKLLN